MKKLMLCALTLGCALAATAEDINVTTVMHAGPYAVRQPLMIDSVDVNSRTFAPADMLDTAVPADAVFADGNNRLRGRANGIQLPKTSSDYALQLLGFTADNETYGKAKVTVDGLTDYAVYVDGTKAGADSIALEPGTHRIVVKCLTTQGQPATVKIGIGSNTDGLLTVGDGGRRKYTLRDVLLGRRFSSVSLSASGRYLLTGYTNTLEGGKTERITRLTDLQTGNIQEFTDAPAAWMPQQDKYHFARQSADGRQLVAVDAATGAETVLAEQLPEGRFIMSPTEDYLIYMVEQSGPKEREDIYEIIEPDDRQPGWRDRYSLAKYDLKTGVMQQLTYGFHNTRLLDISADGRKIAFSISRDRLTQRPTTLGDYYVMDLATMQTEKIIDSDGFVGSCSFSPDGSRLLIQGSPEALGGIGKNVRQDQIPNMYDTQLYLMNLGDRSVRPMTKDFNPSVDHAEWSHADGMIYFTAENKDSVSLYRMNPDNGRIQQLGVAEEMVNDFTLARNAKVLAYGGQGASNSDRVYSVDLTDDSSTLIDDLSKQILDGIELGQCLPWNFVNSRGDTIYGRFYLPPHFDANKKYPLIVNYYGGCSPTSRNFESRYPHHAYAALGYVVYVVNPSGATGFGQEFSARHVNTAGEGVAQDIIEGTTKFLAEHAYADASKVGCIGASYGGFMTQYLQTKTDIFAAAISHAGISDHTSYWGEGYWGYSYSEVSMAGSYPWTRKDLYVDRSPLFNADKIHTPLLFLHGSADTNVPVGESIQMFTALKLLGRPTAFVVVDGQNHHILDYGKRIRWQNTIFAWFQKWLKGDDSWWESMYSKKNL